MLKAVIFDMDGLMLDTEKLLNVFWKKAAAFYGFNMMDEQVLSIRSLSHDLTEKKLKNEFGSGFDYNAVRAKRIELMNSYVAEHGVEKKKGLDELLHFLKTTPLKIGVATATDFQRASMYLKYSGVFDFFDDFVCGDEVKHGKPAPEIYLTAAKKLGVKPENCIALEDSPNGIEAAFNAGCMPIMVPDLSQPDDKIKNMLFALCNDLEDVIDVVNKLFISKSLTI